MSKMGDLHLCYIEAKHSPDIKKTDCDDKKIRRIVRDIVRRSGTRIEEEELSISLIIKELKKV